MSASDVYRLVSCSSGRSRNVRPLSFWPSANSRMRNDDSGSGPSPSAYAMSLGMGMVVFEAISLREGRSDG